MTDIDPLLSGTLPPPSGPPHPPFVATGSATARPARATARTTGSRRRHPAAGGRIIAAGLGATTMFGLIAAMGVAQAASSSTTSTPIVDTSIPLAPLPTVMPLPTVAPTPTVAPVEVTPDPNIPAAPPTVAPTPTAPAPTAPAPTAPAPIVLQARPDVQVVTPAPAPAAPAPVATTSGSR